MSALQAITDLAAQRLFVPDAQERRRIMLMALGEASCGTLECEGCGHCTKFSQEQPYGEGYVIERWTECSHDKHDPMECPAVAAAHECGLDELAIDGVPA